jgi:membrane protein YdbS with pleckstrin-like domain
MKEQTEQEIWDGTPSQWTNFKAFVFGVILVIAIIMVSIVAKNFAISLLALLPIIRMIWKYLLVNTWRIEITNQRIIESKGVFSKSTDELELYRVKDIRLDQPFWLRIVGLSNIYLVTSDRTDSLMDIPAIRNGKDLRENLRNAIEKRRDKKRVREIDFE